MPSHPRAVPAIQSVGCLVGRPEPRDSVSLDGCTQWKPPGLPYEYRPVPVHRLMLARQRSAISQTRSNTDDTSLNTNATVVALLGQEINHQRCIP